MFRVIFLILFCATTAFAQDAGDETDAKVLQEETDSELQNLSIQNEYQEKQKSILDILFGQAEKENDFKIPSGEELAPGEIEVNDNREGDFSNTAQIKVIDKTLGKLYRFDIPVGKSKQFNEIVVRILSCWNPNGKTLLPESKALVEIHEVSNAKPRRLFHGWMFAHAPSANLLEHPNFDVMLARCKAAEVQKEDKERKESAGK